MTLCSESLGNMFQENVVLVCLLGHLLGAQFGYLDIESVLQCLMFPSVCVHTHVCIPLLACLYAQMRN